jgi:hypothetical protein
MDGTAAIVDGSSDEEEEGEASDGQMSDHKGEDVRQAQGGSDTAVEPR